MLKRSKPAFFAVAYLALSAALASAQAWEGVREEITLRAIVDAINDTAQTVTTPSALPGAQVPVVDPDEFRHRLTISVLWGVDNQFSGKMIQEASGQTVGGVPINLSETTFDETYGRMALFKIGAGYRTTPRTEAVFNFVISRSSAETVDIGTVRYSQRAALGGLR